MLAPAGCVDLHLYAGNAVASTPWSAKMSKPAVKIRTDAVRTEVQVVRAAGHGRIEHPKSSQGRCGLTDAAECRHGDAKTGCGRHPWAYWFRCGTSILTSVQECRGKDRIGAPEQQEHLEQPVPAGGRNDDPDPDRRHGEASSESASSKWMRPVVTTRACRHIESAVATTDNPRLVATQPIQTDECQGWPPPSRGSRERHGHPPGLRSGPHLWIATTHAQKPDKPIRSNPWSHHHVQANPCKHRHEEAEDDHHAHPESAGSRWTPNPLDPKVGRSG